MFCPKCGAKLPDGSKFCGVCGEKMPEKKAESEKIVAVENKPYESVVNNDTVVSLGSSTLFLITIVLFTTAILFDILQTGNSFPGMEIINILSFITGSEELDILVDLLGEFSFGGAKKLFAVINYLPTILKAIGLWMIYYSFSKEKGDYKTAQNGFNMLSGIYVLDLVIKEIWCLILWINGISLSKDFLFGEMGKLLITAALMLGVFYFICYNFIRKTLVAGKNSFEGKKENGSLIVALYCIISGSLTVLSSGFELMETMLGISSVLFGIILHKFVKLPMDNGLQYE